MKAYSLLMVGLLLVQGCSTTSGPTPSRPPSTRPASAPTSRAAAPPTRYRQGHWVLYRFSGAYSKQPMQLCERIVKREGNRLEIEVTSTRGDQRRVWIQAVTDTPQNQQSNTLDALFVVEDGRRRRVPLGHVMKLYSWMLLQLEGKPAELKTAPTQLRFGGQRFACTVKSGLRAWRGEPARFSFSACPGFLWTKGPARVWNPETGEDIYRGEVVGFGLQNKGAVAPNGCPSR